MQRSYGLWMDEPKQTVIYQFEYWDERRNRGKGGWKLCKWKWTLDTIQRVYPQHRLGRAEVIPSMRQDAPSGWMKGWKPPR